MSTLEAEARTREQQAAIEEHLAWIAEHGSLRAAIRAHDTRLECGRLGEFLAGRRCVFARNRTRRRYEHKLRPAYPTTTTDRIT